MSRLSLTLQANWFVQTALGFSGLGMPSRESEKITMEVMKGDYLEAFGGPTRASRDRRRGDLHLSEHTDDRA